MTPVTSMIVPAVDDVWFNLSVTQHVQNAMSATKNVTFFVKDNTENGDGRGGDFYAWNPNIPILNISYSNSIPTVPVLTTHTSYHNSGSTTVTWSSSTDADNDAITYDVKVGTTSGGTDVLNYAGDTDTTSNSFTNTPQNTYYWSVRACDPYECSAWATESSFAWTNTAPTIPTLTTPTNNSIAYDVTSINMSWTTSTDDNGDPITYYYFISNNTAFTDIMASGTTTNTFSGNKTITASSQHFFRVIANDTHVNVTSPTVSIRDVSLVSPANNTAYYFVSPPMTYDVNMSWSVTDSAVVDYNLIVSSDSSFAVIISDTTFHGTSKILSLFPGSYWWKVRPYNTETSTYGVYTPTQNYSITDNSTTSGIFGSVFELVNGENVAISGASVFIYSVDWSEQVTTGTNGYYQFTGLVNETYYIKATKSGYDDSVLHTVNYTVGNAYTRNIFIKPTQNQYVPTDHYVKFIVQDIWGTKYPDVLVSAYKGSSLIASPTGTTGDDGSTTLLLIKDQSYRITAINAGLGINTDVTITPIETEYYIIVSATPPQLWEGGSNTEAEAVDFVVTSLEINSTHAYINASYNDSMAQTTAWTIYLNQTNKTNGQSAQITLQSSIGTGNGTVSFIVSGYKGQSYLMNVVATHTTFGTIRRSFGVAFNGLPGGQLDFIPSILKAMIAIGSMIFIGAIFGQTSRNQGAGAVVGWGWIMLSLGFFEYFDTTKIAAGLVLATIFAVVMNMSERNRQEGMT